MTDPPSLLAHREPAWSDAGLGSPAVHVQVKGMDVTALATQIGPHLCATVAPDLLRLEPSIDLPTLTALLETHGWTVSREGEILRAFAKPSLSR